MEDILIILINDYRLTSNQEILISILDTVKPELNNSLTRFSISPEFLEDLRAEAFLAIHEALSLVTVYKITSYSSYIRSIIRDAAIKISLLYPKCSGDLLEQVTFNTTSDDYGFEEFNRLSETNYSPTEFVQRQQNLDITTLFMKKSLLNC